jgi:hypothetical protein
MEKLQSNQDKNYGFVIINDDDETTPPPSFLRNVVEYSTTAISLASSGITLTARLIGTALGGLGKLTVLASKFVSDSLAVKQGFKTDGTMTSMAFTNVEFFTIEGTILGFRTENRCCGFEFNLDISKIEMFRLTNDIGLFLFHTRDGNTVATVFTNQHNGKELILTKITDDESRFVRFEFEVCIYGTVSLTVIYTNRPEKYFQIERNGSFTEVVRPSI